MKFDDLLIRAAVLSDFQENAYVLNVAGRDDCVVVDPGMEPAPLIRTLDAKRLTPKALLATHGHWDHIGGISEVRDRWPGVPIYIGANERSKLTDPIGNLTSAFGFPQTTDEADRALKDGETFEVAGITFETLEIPGHTRGHVAYLVKTDDRAVVFGGDILFAGSVGRTDFADGDGPGLIAGIRAKLLTLPDDTLIFPGHGPATTIRAEKSGNPYLQ